MLDLSAKSRERSMTQIPNIPNSDFPLLKLYFSELTVCCEKISKKIIYFSASLDRWWWVPLKIDDAQSVTNYVGGIEKNGVFMNLVLLYKIY